jgi:hypothetical protein
VLGSFTPTSITSGTFSGTQFGLSFGADANYLNNVAAGVVEGGVSFYPKTIVNSGGGGALTSSQLSNAGADATSTTIGAYASGSPTAPNGWSFQVARSASLPGINGNNFSTQVGNPMQNLVNGVITETLTGYSQASLTGARVATTLGTITIDANADSWNFTGAAAAVPEPTTYGLLAGAGMLALSLRRQFTRKNA